MPRLPTRPTTEVPELADVFAGVERGLGIVPNSLRTMAHRPDIARAFAALNAAVMGPGRVEPGLKLLVAYMVSSSAASAYCQAHTAMVSDEIGVEVAKIRQVGQFETSPLFSPRERAALRVASGAGQVPNAVTDEDVAHLRAHFDAEQVVELVSVIAMFGFLNRWNETLATTLEPAPMAFAQEHLAVGGWRGDKHVDTPPASNAPSADQDIEHP